MRDMSNKSLNRRRGWQQLVNVHVVRAENRWVFIWLTYIALAVFFMYLPLSCSLYLWGNIDC